MVVSLVAVLGFAPAFALAQAQREETMLVGQVQSVDETGTAITLTDGTKLLTPSGSVISFYAQRIAEAVTTQTVRGSCMRAFAIASKAASNWSSKRTSNV